MIYSMVHRLAQAPQLKSWHTMVPPAHKSAKTEESGVFFHERRGSASSITAATSETCAALPCAQTSSHLRALVLLWHICKSYHDCPGRMTGPALCWVLWSGSCTAPIQTLLQSHLQLQSL